MKAFSNFDGFYKKLFESINSKKDVYLFNFICDSTHDFWYDDEDTEHHNFYVNPFINLSAIQKYILMSAELPDDVAEDLKTSLDYYYDDECDDMVQRLFIFQSK